MDRHRMDGDIPLIRERGYRVEQLTEEERREFAERLREDDSMRASSRYERFEPEMRGRR
jgi:hypothetical protein